MHMFPNLRPSMSKVVAILMGIHKVIQVLVVDIIEKGGGLSESSVQRGDQEETAYPHEKEAATATTSLSTSTSSFASTSDNLFVIKRSQHTICSRAKVHKRKLQDIRRIEDIRTESD